MAEMGWHVPNAFATRLHCIIFQQQQQQLGQLLGELQKAYLNLAWMSSERDRLQEELEREKRYNQGWIAHAEQISRQKQELFCELATAKEAAGLRKEVRALRKQARKRDRWEKDCYGYIRDLQDQLFDAEETIQCLLEANSPSMEGQEKQCSEDGITAIRDDPVDTGHLGTTLPLSSRAAGKCVETFEDAAHGLPETPRGSSQDHPTKDLPEPPLAPQEDEDQAVETPRDAEPDHEGFHETQPEANSCPSSRCRASSTTSPAEDGLQDGKTTFLPSELWPLLLEFLPVTEVATTQTRAVSSFFSNSKVWVAHLFKLMDLDSLPEHCAGDLRHPGLEFKKYDDDLSGNKFEGAEEYKRNASEGFQGYRLWFNGLFQWHKRHPEMSLHFIQMVMQWFGSEQIRLANVAKTFCTSVNITGIRALTLPLANRLLEWLHADLRPKPRRAALNILKHSQGVYPHLNVKLVFELFETVMSWEELDARREARMIAEGILHVIVMDDETLARAFRHARSLHEAEHKGDMNEAAAKLQMMGVLREHFGDQSAQLKKNK